MPPSLVFADAAVVAVEIVAAAEQASVVVIADLQALLPAKAAGFAGAAVVVDGVVAADEAVSVAAVPVLAFVPLRDTYR